jgi:cysteine desulfurase
MNSETPIYLDYNASTPIYPEVADVMRPLLETGYGNPSSPHFAAEAARAAIVAARHQLADLLGAAPDEVVFTSGGSEANNFALKGAFHAQRDRGNHIITSQVEHPAILEPCRYLETQGAEVTYIPVDGTGRVDPDDVRKAITARTTLISIMHSNNEVGTLQPVEDIALIANDHGLLMHTDAAQSTGKVALNADDLGVSLLSLAGHKFGAPKGIGALYIRRGVALERLIHGAGHEGGRRAGTESALLMAGLGKAAAIAAPLSSVKSMLGLRELFWSGLQAIFEDGDAERPSLRPSAEYPECVLRRPSGSRRPAAVGRRWRLHRVGLSFGAGGTLPGADRHGHRRRPGFGRGTLQPGTLYHRRGNQCGAAVVEAAAFLMAPLAPLPPRRSLRALRPLRPLLPRRAYKGNKLGWNGSPSRLNVWVGSTSGHPAP